MFTEIQSQIVQKLEDKRQDDAANPPSGLLVPDAVRAYGGELLQVKRLVGTVPVVFVEYDVASLIPADAGGNTGQGPITFDVICASHTQRSVSDEYSDGVALLTWAYESLLGMYLIVGDQRAYWGSMSTQRLATTERVWLAKIGVTMEFN